MPEVKQNLFTLNRDYTLVSLLGHAISFVKDTPVHVPPSLVSEALAIGAVAADGKPQKVLEDDSVDITPQDAAARRAAVLAAIDKIVAANVREDFTAAGAPSAAAVTREAGFRVGVKEITTAIQARIDEQEKGK